MHTMPISNNSPPSDVFKLFKPLRAKRASDQIAQRIRSLILAKRLKPGDRLPSERSLAENFQVGRLTIRESLRVLEDRGLIQIKKGGTGGAFVASPDAGGEDATSILTDNLELNGITGTQIGEARQVLGHGIAKLAIRNATAEDLDEIRRYIGEYEIATSPEAIRELVSKVISFQNLLAKASHNPPLIAFTRILAEWSRRKLLYWYPSEDEQILMVRFHKELFKSIEMKDVSRAQRVTNRLVAAVDQRVHRLGID